MQHGSQSKTDGRSMARIHYGEHSEPKGGSNSMSVARRREDREAIEEQLSEQDTENDPSA